MTIAFDAVGLSAPSGLQTTTLTQSWTHPGGSGIDSLGIICVEATNNASGGFVPTGTPIASIGGFPLNYLGSVLMNNAATLGWLEVFAALGVPLGSQTATYTTSGGAGANVASANGSSYTYTGVDSYGILQTAFGSANPNGVTVPSAIGRKVWGVIGNYGSGSYSSLSFTQQQVQGSGPAFVGGDMVGTASAVFSATQSSTFGWAAVGLDLRAKIASNRNINQAVQAALR